MSSGEQRLKGGAWYLEVLGSPGRHDLFNHFRLKFFYKRTYTDNDEYVAGIEPATARYAEIGITPKPIS